MDGYLSDSHNLSASWDQPNLLYSGPSIISAPFVYDVSPPGFFWPSSHWKGKITGTLVFCVPLILTYLITLCKSNAAVRNQSDLKEPVLVPYWFPLIGHVVSYMSDSARLASSITKRFGNSVVVRLQFFSKEVYLVSGSDNLNAIWRNTRGLTSTNGIIIALANMFNTPKRDMDFFNLDNSGITHDPHPNSEIQPENRVFYLMHKATVDFLSGSHLVSSARSFQIALRKRIDTISVGDDWVDMPDLYTFLQPHISHATLEAMCGSFFLSLNPSFVEDFWNFNRNMPRLLQGWPRWLMPKAWKARDKCLESMIKWRRASSGLVHTASTDPNFFGNDMMRERWKYFSKMEGLSEAGVASSDLGIIWGMNSNSMPSTFWYFWEITRDPQLLSRVLCEVNTCLSDISTPGSLDFNVSKLCNQPLLQSIYAETLRMRIAVYIIRKAEYQDARVKDYVVPQNQMLVTNSNTAHMNKQDWNTGNENTHPVEEFWADRFLTYAKDTQSTSPETDEISSGAQKSTEGARFSLNGRAGAWIPFGGGIHQCPGRHWVKLQIILSFAMMCSTFDIELTDGAAHIQPDMRKYGLGALPPKSEAPFRIRRKRT